MTALNARANQAWLEVSEEMSQKGDWFEHEQNAFEEGWETGYKAAVEDIARTLEAIPDEVYPPDIFPPDGISVDAHSARVMRVAYPAAAHIARNLVPE